MCGSPNKNPGMCQCQGEGLRGFIQPRILLQLANGSTHGYELIDLLRKQGEEHCPDAGNLYRTLRWMEDQGLVRSNWDTSSAGAARRIYEITDQGVAYLHDWAARLVQTRRRVDGFLHAYEHLFQNEVDRQK